MSSDFLKQRTTLRYPTDFLIGDLLVRAGVVTAKQLDEAVRLAGNKHVHVGQMLIMARYLSQRDLQAAVDAQSAVRDRTIDMNAAVKALKQACRTNITFAEACRSQDNYTSGDGPTNRLGEILLEAGLINRDQFAKAMQRSLATGLPLGRILVLNNALGEPLLAMVLELQVRVRDEIMSRDEAIIQLKEICEQNSPETLSAEEAYQIQQSLLPPRKKGIRLGELLVLAGLLQEADVMNALELGLSNNMQIGQVIVNQGFISTELLDSALRLQELVDCEQMSSEQAAETLHRVHETGVSVEEAVEQIGLGLTEAGVKELSYQTLLTLARVVTEEAIHEAFELIRQTPEYTAQLLAITGHIQPITAEATVRCHWLINNGYLNQDDALVALDFCLQKQTESEITFDDALEELGWSLGDGQHAEVEEGALSEEEATSLFGQDLAVDPLTAEEDSELAPSLLAEPEAAEEESLVEEPIVEEPVVEEPILEEPLLEEPIKEEPVLEEEPEVEEPLLEESLLEEVKSPETESLSEEEAEPTIQFSEEQEELLLLIDEDSPVTLDDESILLVEEDSLLEQEEPEAIGDLLEEELTPESLQEEEPVLESEPVAEIEEEAPQAPALQNLFAKRRDVGNETVDSLPAIGDTHGYLSESLSEPFENPDSAMLYKAEPDEEDNGNGAHLETLEQETEEETVAEEISAAEETIVATDYSSFEFEPSAELMELEENFGVLEDSDAIQLLEETDETQLQFEEVALDAEPAEELPAIEAAASEGEDFAPAEPAPRQRGLGALFAAKEEDLAPEAEFSPPKNGHSENGHDDRDKQSTTGNGKVAAAAGTKAGANKGMSLKSLLESYNTDSPEPEAEPEPLEMADLAASSAKSPAKKADLVLSEKDQMILAAASSLTATPEEIKAAALILAGNQASKAPAATSPAAASPVAKATAAPPVKEKEPIQAKAPMRTAGQLLSGAHAAPLPAQKAVAPAAAAKSTVVAEKEPVKTVKPQAAPSPEPVAKSAAESEAGAEEINSVLGEAFVRLAESYYEQGNYPEAEKLYTRILTLREKELGMKNPLLLNDLNNLAGVLCVQGKFSDAEVFVQRSVNIVESHEPDNILKLADGLNTLAGIYYQQDKYEQCEPLLERALRLRQRALGEDHPDIADNLRDYAKFLKKVNRPEEAEKMYAQAKAVLSKALKNATR